MNVNLSDQKVYVGNKLYRRTVWGLHRERETGRVYGFVRLGGQAVQVWDVNGGHWNATRPE
jgi:hypothetical protein